MKKQRKHYTPEEKVAILRQHLLEQVPISELCDKHGLQPTVFYRWQKEFFENGAAAFQPKARPNYSSEQERIIAKDFKEFIRISGMPTSELRPTILNRTEKSNAGTNRSRKSASGRERHFRWMMH